MLLFSLITSDSQYETRWKNSCKHYNPVRSYAKNWSEITFILKVVCLLQTIFSSLFRVLTNQMIKQEVSVTKQYCKHTNQSLFPSELPPGAVRGNKMENQPNSLSSSDEKQLSQSPGDAPRKQNHICSRAAPACLQDRGSMAKKLLYPSLLSSVLSPVQCLLPLPFIQALGNCCTVGSLTFPFAVTMAK